MTTIIMPRLTNTEQFYKAIKEVLNTVDETTAKVVDTTVNTVGLRSFTAASLRTFVEKLTGRSVQELLHRYADAHNSDLKLSQEGYYLQPRYKFESEFIEVAEANDFLILFDKVSDASLSELELRTAQEKVASLFQYWCVATSKFPRGHNFNPKFGLACVRYKGDLLMDSDDSQEFDAFAQQAIMDKGSPKRQNGSQLFTFTDREVECIKKFKVTILSY